MKNKIELKKLIVVCFICCSIFIGINIWHTYKQFNCYNKNLNNKILSISEVILEKYPDIDKNDLMEILNSPPSETKDIFREYGIDINKESVVLENQKELNRFIFLDTFCYILFFLILAFLISCYIKKQERKVLEITKYLEEINKGNYKLDIEDNTEDELSILKNELYKVTVMLKEIAEISKQDKLKLKDSLSDISHQLKTPITSIFIILDNILDAEDMPEYIKREFLKDIKREVVNIKFLVEAILKLSKIDSNTVKYLKKEEYLQDIINDAIKNVSIIKELKNININLNKKSESKIICDRKWQVEALTNIIKNCIEHSKENSNIDIECEENSVYFQIKIRDYGVGISKKDLPHIFERFYKGKNSSNESIGIGLALSKAIIESNNGYIKVDSTEGEGTTFIIKYIK